MWLVPKQINGNERHQKIRHQYRGAGVFFRHALAEKERQNRDGRNDRAVKGDRWMVRREHDQETADGTQNTSAGFQNC